MAETRISKPKTRAKVSAKAPAKSKPSKRRVACAEDPPENPRAAAKRLGRLLEGCEEAFDLLLVDAWETEQPGEFRESLLAAARVAKAAAALGLAMNRLAGESRHRIVFERGPSGSGAADPRAADPRVSGPRVLDSSAPSLEDTRPAAALLPAPEHEPEHRPKHRPEPAPGDEPCDPASARKTRR